MLPFSRTKLIENIKFMVPTSVSKTEWHSFAFSQLSKKLGLVNTTLLDFQSTRIETNGPNIDIYVDIKELLDAGLDQMKKNNSKPISELYGEIQQRSQAEKLVARRDCLLRFSQVISTFVKVKFLAPLRYPKNFYISLENQNNLQLRNQVQQIGAPFGITVDHILEWSPIMNDRHADAHPVVTQVEFMAAAKTLTEERQIQASSVKVFEKVFETFSVIQKFNFKKFNKTV